MKTTLKTLFLFLILAIGATSCIKEALPNHPSQVAFALAADELAVTADPGLPMNTNPGEPIIGTFHNGAVVVQGIYGYGADGDDMQTRVHNEWVRVENEFYRLYGYAPPANAFYIKVQSSSDNNFIYVVRAVSGYVIW